MNGLVSDTNTVFMYLTVYCCSTKVDERIDVSFRAGHVASHALNRNSLAM